MVISRFAAFAGVLCLAMAGAAAQPEPPGRAPAATPLAASVQTDKKTYRGKDPVKLTFTVKNPTKSPVKLMFGGMKYDFEIRKGKSPSGEKIWQWSQGRMFAQIVTQTTLDPGKQLTYTETFTPGENGPTNKLIPALDPGIYTATGILTLIGRAPRPMAHTTFTVK